jgi:hypothetical protein
MTSFGLDNRGSIRGRGKDFSNDNRHAQTNYCGLPRKRAEREVHHISSTQNIYVLTSHKFPPRDSYS